MNCKKLLLFVFGFFGALHSTSETGAEYHIILRAMNGEILATDHFEDEKEFKKSVSEIEGTFEEHVKRTGKSSLYAQDFFGYDDAFNIAKFCYFEPEALLTKKPESQTATRYELSCIRNSDITILAASYCRDECELFVASWPYRFWLICKYRRSVADDQFRVFTSFSIPNQAEELFQNKVENANLPLKYISIHKERGKLSYEPDESLQIDATILSFESIAEAVERAKALFSDVAILRSIPESKPETQFIKFNFTYSMTDIIPGDWEPVQYIKTNDAWEFLKLDDGILDTDSATRFMNVFRLDVKKLEIHKSGGKFEFHPIGETQDSKFGIRDIYIKPASTDSGCACFVVVIYDPSCGFIQLVSQYSNMYINDLCTDEYKALDFFGKDLSHARNLFELRNLIQSEMRNIRAHNSLQVYYISMTGGEGQVHLFGRNKVAQLPFYTIQLAVD